MKSSTFNQLSPQQQTALVIAMQVRNAMEDFHTTQLSNRQMKALNQIMRYGIYNAMDLLNTMAGDPMKEFYFGQLIDAIPDYWEIPGRDPEPVATVGNAFKLTKDEIQDGKQAIHAWVKRLPIDSDQGLQTIEHCDTVVLKDSDVPVARFLIRDGRWALQWQRVTGRWADYSPQTFRVLDHLFARVEEDKDGCFWG